MVKHMEMEKEFIGVYSRTDIRQVKTYYFIFKNDNLVYVQKLNALFQPSEALKMIDEQSFRSLFTPEPQIKKIPKSKMYTGQKKKPEILSSHKVEESLRELFRKALVRMRRGTIEDGALSILENLTTVEEGITKEHKHMFNEFGIEMRKKKSYPHALAFSKRVIAMNSNDDHAHFNVARVLMEMEEFEEAEQHLLTAQFLNPGSKIYAKALQHISVLRLQKELDAPIDDDSDWKI